MSDPAKQAAERLDAAREQRKATKPTFKRVDEGRYKFHLPEIQTTMELDFLRREGRQLKGELLVRCELKGAKTFDGVLSVGDFNLSSPRTRKSQAQYLRERAQTKNVDWPSYLEEFCQRTLAAEREGEPSVLLHELEPPGPNPAYLIHGFPLLKNDVNMIFGDGDGGKSTIALFLAAELADSGVRVLFADWETDGGVHRDRLGKLYVNDMPNIHYVRCSKPLTLEMERLRRVIREHEIQFGIFDSVAFACDGPPESAEVAARYFQSLRQLGPIGSLHVAHVTKAFEGNDKKPFGSVFWFNGARSIWNLKPAETMPESDRLIVAMHQRKHNTGARHRSVGWEISYMADRMLVRSVDISEVEELAKDLSVPERLNIALRRGPLTREQLKLELEDVNDNTFRVTLNRAIKDGKVLPFPGDVERYALADRRHE